MFSMSTFLLGSQCSLLLLELLWFCGWNREQQPRLLSKDIIKYGHARSYRDLAFLHLFDLLMNKLELASTPQNASAQRGRFQLPKSEN